MQDYAETVPDGNLGDWIVKWPSQVVNLAIMIQHNFSMEKYLFKQKDYIEFENNEPTIEEIYEEVNHHIEEATDLVRSDLETNARLNV